MNEFLLVLAGIMIACIVFANSDTLTFVSKDMHVKYLGEIYKMKKVEDNERD